VVEEALIRKLEGELPELPGAKRERFMREYRLPEYDAGVLTASRAAADYFEALVKASGAEPKACANWQMGELAAALNREDRNIGASPVSPQMLAGIVKRVSDGTISGKGGKQVFEAMWKQGGGADEIIERGGLRQMSDAGAIERIVDEVLAANPRQVEDFRAGKEKAFNSLVGQVMKATRGKANPAQVNETLRKKLT
jgi:aspartyl-tRNA(Asn)/glutamyl-tRNA(Gln) amidotransferase subunit B